MEGSLAIFIGLETIVFGTEALVSGAAKWIGGIMIFAMLSLLTIPLGLLLRRLVEGLPLTPLGGALVGGVSVSLVLMFVLHPAMYPTLNFLSHPISLIFVHSGAGLVGGWIWYVIEFETGGRADYE